jgi:hypothetical protein
MPACNFRSSANLANVRRQVICACTREPVGTRSWPDWPYANPVVPVVPLQIRGTTGTASDTRIALGYCSVFNSSPSMRLIRNRLAYSRGTEQPLSWHRLGPLDMPLVAKRFRHVAVAVPEVRVSRVIAVSLRQQST